MLDQLKQIAIFVKTVDHGSFRGAARVLDLSPSVVSHHIAALEDRLGTALLYRSTRKLSVTDDGKRLLAHARDMITAAETGLDAIVESGQSLSGELHVTAPAVLAQSAFVERVTAFSNAHPNMRLDLDFTDTRRSMVDNGIDVAIRMGWLKDSTLKARKLYDVRRVLVAAQSCVSALPMPEHPKDLQDWDWLELSPVRMKPAFVGPMAQRVTLKTAPRISVNDAHALYGLAKAGAGLAIVPDFLAKPGLTDGTMQQLLPDWQLDPVGVYAVWPPNAPKEGLTARFVEALIPHEARTTKPR